MYPQAGIEDVEVQREQQKKQVRRNTNYPFVYAVEMLFRYATCPARESKVASNCKRHWSLLARFESLLFASAYSVLRRCAGWAWINRVTSSILLNSWPNSSSGTASNFPNAPLYPYSTTSSSSSRAAQSAVCQSPLLNFLFERSLEILYYECGNSHPPFLPYGYYTLQGVHLWAGINAFLYSRAVTRYMITNSPSTHLVPLSPMDSGMHNLLPNVALS